jgi:hypothetical protein
VAVQIANYKGCAICNVAVQEQTRTNGHYDHETLYAHETLFAQECRNKQGSQPITAQGIVLDCLATQHVIKTNDIIYDSHE